MKKKRIQYNEINSEIYNEKTWSKSILVFIGIFILLLGFLLNFSLEEKINKFLLTTLSSNESCPINFEKAELSYFFPKVTVKKPVIMGACFGNPENRLPLREFTISMSGISFYPLGQKFHISLNEGKTHVNIYLTLSIFSHYIDIEKTEIDSQILSAMSSSGKSLIAGNLSIDGFLKIENNSFTDGKFDITSTNLSIPSQTISGFDMPMLPLNHLSIKMIFLNSRSIEVNHIEIGKMGMPVQIRLKGKISIEPSNFMTSRINVEGPLRLSPYFMQNFSFIKLFLPQNNNSGNYQMKIDGTLSNLGTPQFY